jgi:branched-chain amino acid transport system ATP-binding protein
MIDLEGANAYYGQTQVLFNLSLQLPDRGCIGLLGRNGAGKTSLLRSIVGMEISCTGELRLDGRSITGLPPEAKARLGIAYVPQERDVFANLTVEENLRLGESCGREAEVGFHRKDVFELFPRLRERLAHRAGSLSGGERKMLAMSRGLLMNPSVLLLDEPTEGVWHEIVAELARAIRQCADRMLVVLAEQNLDFVFAAASRCMVLERGVVVADRDATLLQQSSELGRWLAM